AAAPATRSALAALGALCVVAALPGSATAGPGDLPPYRHADGAERSQGARSSADGPRLEAGGTYTATLAPGEKRYWSVELDAETQPWISAVAPPEPGSAVTYRDGIRLTLEDADGTTCDTADAGIDDDGAARPVAAVAGRIRTPDGRCQEAGVYHFSVEREERAEEDASDPAPWPLELRVMREPGLESITSTTPPETGELPTTPPRPPAGEAEELTGGTGFNDAPGMGEGVWKDRLRPGQTRFYRVPVDWGQQLALSAEFGTVGGADDGYVSDGVRVDLHNPARGHVDGGSATYRPDDPAAVPLLAPPVRYVNRYSYNDALAASAHAGWYYVAVHAHAGLREVLRGGDGTVPVTLRTTLTGAPQQGPPYDGDAVAAGFGVGDAEREQAEQGLSAQEAAARAGRSDTLRLVGVAGIGTGTLLLAGLGAWTVLARRRSPGEAGVPGGPYGAPQPPHGG
ncbi:hypothetical protein, partial [Streptomyces sp. JJ36]|uniref:hypothetical protein n=1 Tax=Streptomyces sp. JJ36 TaxID=2736645 RepID=UPI001F3D2E18